MFLFDLFKVLGKADSIADIIRAIKEIKEAIEAIETLIEKFKGADE